MIKKVDIINLTEQDLIKLAKSTQDSKVLLKLSDSVYTSVRRCVAKNSYSSSFIVNRLANDCAYNVSYFANKHQKCTIKNRRKEFSHPCIICMVDELDYISKCNSCESLKAYSC